MKNIADPSTGIIDPDFCRWAFGSEITEADCETGLGLMNLWNNLHGNELTLDREGNIGFDLERMGVLWAHEGYPDGREIVI